jgi:GrpB-like predicted nucleotidyltransferase (UPF0157 family)
MFDVEARRWRDLLGDLLVKVHHIGSTSVPGLVAKPVIDLVPEVRDITQVDAYTGQIEESGYRAWGEYGLPGRRFFTKDAGEFRTHNIHVYETGDREIVRHVAFCAYLRNHAGARRAYEALKRIAYAKHPADIDAYCHFKNAWIKRVEGLAVAWYRAQGE